MKKKINKEKVDKKFKVEEGRKCNCKFLKTAMWLFLVMPIFFIVYLYVTSVNLEESISTLMISNPSTTISFIAAMINPFCALICRQAINDLESGKNPEPIKINLIILTLSQVLILNVIGFGVLVFALIKTLNWEDSSLIQGVCSIKAEYVATRISSTILIVLLSSMCGFLIYRVNLL